jgi:DNA-binding transcriptional regulator YhcF (GntR family)
MFGKKKTKADAAMFSARIRSVFQLARAEAVRLGKDYVGPEHLLLGLLLEEEGAHGSILASLGVETGELKARVEETLPDRGAGHGARSAGPSRSAQTLPWTTRAKKAIDGAIAEARELGDSLVDSEHLLLGLLRDVRSIAAVALSELGVSWSGARAELLRIRGETAASATGPASPATGATSPGTTAPEAGANSPETGAPFTVRIDDDSNRTIYEQIMGQLKEAAATGRLRAGGRLPPVRELADRLGIAPGTVARAYRELEERGVVVTQGARGTFVAEGRREGVPEEERPGVLVGLLRPVAVAAFHLGATEAELRTALEGAMEGIFEGEGGAGETGAG